MSVAITKNHAFLLINILQLCKASQGIQQTIGSRNKTPTASGMFCTGECRKWFIVKNKFEINRIFVLIILIWFKLPQMGNISKTFILVPNLPINGQEISICNIVTRSNGLKRPNTNLINLEKRGVYFKGRRRA